MKEKYMWKKRIDRIIYYCEYATAFVYFNKDRVESITLYFGDEKIMLDKRRLSLLNSVLEKINEDGYVWIEGEVEK